MERERRKYKECVEINHPKQSRILIRAIVQDAYAASQVHEVYLGTYHSNNDIVRNKFSRIHVLFGELSNFRLIGDGSSQHITSRQMNKAVLVLDDLALRALAAGGSTGDDNLERILDSLADTAAAVGNRSGSSGGSPHLLGLLRGRWNVEFSSTRSSVFSASARRAVFDVGVREAIGAKAVAEARRPVKTAARRNIILLK